MYILLVTNNEYLGALLRVYMRFATFNTLYGGRENSACKLERCVYRWRDDHCWFNYLIWLRSKKKNGLQDAACPKAKINGD